MERTAAHIVDFIQKLEVLKLIPRMGWKLRGIKECESVADHSFRVIVISMLLSDFLSDTFTIDKERVMKMAALHELGECNLMDMPLVTVETLGKSKKRAAELTAFTSVVSSIPENIQKDYTAVWQEYAAADTIESKIVAFADKFEMLLQAMEYETTGYGNLQDFWNNRQNMNTYNIDLFEQLIQHLFTRRHQEAD